MVDDIRIPGVMTAVFRRYGFARVTAGDRLNFARVAELVDADWGVEPLLCMYLPM